jgi:hypothetical protein
MTFYFLQTCPACPEQYDVYTKNGQQVGYVRLRWGELRVDYPKVGCEVIYQHKFEDNMKGGFDNQKERDEYLSNIVEALKPLLYADHLECTYELVKDADWLLDKVYGEDA